MPKSGRIVVAAVFVIVAALAQTVRLKPDTTYFPFSYFPITYAAGSQQQSVSESIARGGELQVHFDFRVTARAVSAEPAPARADSRRIQSLTTAEIQSIIRNGTSSGMPPFPALTEQSSRALPRSCAR